jgi:hypothetical protein
VQRGSLAAKGLASAFAVYAVACAPYGWLLFRDELVPLVILYLVVFDIFCVVLAVLVIRWAWQPGRDRS